MPPRPLLHCYPFPQWHHRGPCYTVDYFPNDTTEAPVTLLPIPPLSPPRPLLHCYLFPHCRWRHRGPCYTVDYFPAVDDAARACQEHAGDAARQCQAARRRARVGCHCCRDRQRPAAQGQAAAGRPRGRPPVKGQSKVGSRALAALAEPVDILITVQPYINHSMYWQNIKQKIISLGLKITWVCIAILFISCSIIL